MLSFPPNPVNGQTHIPENGQSYTFNGTVWNVTTGFTSLWGTVGGTLSDQTDLQTALDDKSSASHDHDLSYEPINSNIQSHISSTGNPHGLTLSDIGAAADSHDHDLAYEPINPNIQTHISSTENPHSVTKTQVGLGSVDNTSDADKPISTLTQTALNGKSDTTHDHDLVYEPVLGNPDTDGKILSSTAAGVRSWIAAPSGGGTVDWSDVQNKPSTFTPSAHTHDYEVSGAAAAAVTAHEQAANPHPGYLTQTEGDLLYAPIGGGGGGGGSNYTLLDTTTLNGSSVYDLTLTPGKTYLFVVENATYIPNGSDGMYFRITAGGGQTSNQVTYSLIEDGNSAVYHSSASPCIPFTARGINYGELLVKVDAQGYALARFHMFDNSGGMNFNMGVGRTSVPVDRARLYFSADPSVGTIKRYEVNYG